MVVRVSREAPLVARASTVIGAPGEKIWSTLTASDAFLRLMPLIRTTHRVTIALRDDGAGTRVSVEEDGHRKEVDLAHGEGAWRLVLANPKAVVEGRQEDGPDTLPGPS